MLAVFATMPLHAADQPPLTLDRLFESPSLVGLTPSRPVWSPDSRSIAFTWNDEGMPRRGLWLADRDGSGLERLDAATDTSAAVREIAWLPDSRRVISLRGSELWSTSLDDDQDIALADVGGDAVDLSISPDGRKAAYRRDGDLWVLELDSHENTPLTRVGMPGLSSLALGRYSRPEREIGPGIWGGPTYAWSPDGRYIAVHHVDRREMRKVPFPDYLAAETDPNEVRRGYPGDANETRTVGLVDVAERRTRSSVSPGRRTASCCWTSPRIPRSTAGSTPSNRATTSRERFGTAIATAESTRRSPRRGTQTASGSCF
jgi:dipeptidyl-peptidase-4